MCILVVFIPGSDVLGHKVCTQPAVLEVEVLFLKSAMMQTGCRGNEGWRASEVRQVVGEFGEIVNRGAEKPNYRNWMK